MSNPEYEAPKRGQQIESTNDDVDYVGESATVETYPEPDWSDDNPIPVYIVAESETPEITKWSSNRAPIADAMAASILSARRNRSRAVVINVGPDSVFLGVDGQMNPALSFELAMGESIEFTHNSAVWAKCAAGESATVSYIEEYVVPLNE